MSARTAEHLPTGGIHIGKGARRDRKPDLDITISKTNASSMSKNDQQHDETEPKYDQECPSHHAILVVARREQAAVETANPQMVDAFLATGNWNNVGTTSIDEPFDSMEEFKVFFPPPERRYSSLYYDISYPPILKRLKKHKAQGDFNLQPEGAEHARGLYLRFHGILPGWQAAFESKDEPDPSSHRQMVSEPSTGPRSEYQC